MLLACLGFFFSFFFAIAERACFGLCACGLSFAFYLQFMLLMPLRKRRILSFLGLCKLVSFPAIFDAGTFASVGLSADSLRAVVFYRRAHCCWSSTTTRGLRRECLLSLACKCCSRSH